MIGANLLAGSLSAREVADLHNAGVIDRAEARNAVGGLEEEQAGGRVDLKAAVEVGNITQDLAEAIERERAHCTQHTAAIAAPPLNEEQKAQFQRHFEQQRMQQPVAQRDVGGPPTPVPVGATGPLPPPEHLLAIAAASGGWRPAQGDITRVPAMLKHNGHLVDLFHRIRGAATFHDAQDIERIWASGPAGALQLFPTDAKMQSLPEGLWNEICTFTPTADTINQYVSEVNDCDGHAALFVGLCAAMWYMGVGQVLDLSGQHSYNAVLVHPGKGTLPEVRIVEPQQSGFVPAERLGQHPYTLERGLVIMR